MLFERSEREAFVADDIDSVLDEASEKVEQVRAPELPGWDVSWIPGGYLLDDIITCCCKRKD